VFQGRQTAGLNALNNRGQWPDGWQTAGLKALNNRGQWLANGTRERPNNRTRLTTEGSGLSAWSKLPRRILRI